MSDNENRAPDKRTPWNNGKLIRAAHIGVIAARRRRVAGYFCARWRLTSALHPVARLR